MSLTGQRQPTLRRRGIQDQHNFSTVPTPAATSIQPERNRPSLPAIVLSGGGTVGFAMPLHAGLVDSFSDRTDHTYAYGAERDGLLLAGLWKVLAN